MRYGAAGGGRERRQQQQLLWGRGVGFHGAAGVRWGPLPRRVRVSLWVAGRSVAWKEEPLWGSLPGLAPSRLLPPCVSLP